MVIKRKTTMNKGLYTPVVFTLEDLKKIYDAEAYGKKGMWAFHAKFHEGHQQCAKLTNENCDWVVGILWNNFAAGMKWMVGETADIDDPIRTADVEVLKNNSDVVMIFTGHYHPYKQNWKMIKEIFDREFPQEFLKEKGILNELTLYSSLLYSVAIRIVIHEIYGIKLDYHATCGRDRWRFVKYTDWIKQRFGVFADVQDAVRDDNGNVISGMRNRIPEKYNNRIQKPLILPHFESIEEVNNHIKDIPDLKALHFSKECDWIHVKFQFADKYWWSEGLKLCKS
jgi:hypothetical protein